MTVPDLNKLLQTVDIDSNKIQEIVDGIVQPYSKDLDNYVDFVKSVLKDGENPPTNQELDDFCMNLSVYIYYAGCMQEYIGIKDDIARAIYKEMYHSERDKITSGTVADKDSLAELASQQEALVSAAYKRSYQIMKMKVSSAQEILASCKKVLSRRMSEAELTRIGGN